MLKKKAKYTISIPEPCHEDWDKMTPVERGKFCDVCEKTIVDFSSFSDQRLIDFLENKPETICGRLSHLQMNRTLLSKSRGENLLARSSAIFAFLGSSLAIYGQEDVYYPTSADKINIESKNHLPSFNTLRKTEKEITIAGCLRNEEGEVIPFAYIHVLGFNSIETNSDFDGNFLLTFKTNKEKVKIKISELSVSSKIIDIDCAKDSVNLGTIVMKDSEQLFSTGIIVRISPEKKRQLKKEAKTNRKAKRKKKPNQQ